MIGNEQRIIEGREWRLFNGKDDELPFACFELEASVGNSHGDGQLGMCLTIISTWMELEPEE